MGFFSLQGQERLNVDLAERIESGDEHVRDARILSRTRLMRLSPLKAAITNGGTLGECRHGSGVLVHARCVYTSTWNFSTDRYDNLGKQTQPTLLLHQHVRFVKPKLVLSPQLQRDTSGHHQRRETGIRPALTKT